MHDNKVRLSQDVLDKAEQIANEWGLKNARAAVEAVFRRYCDDYLYGRMTTFQGAAPIAMVSPAASYGPSPVQPQKVAIPNAGQEGGNSPSCEALDALDRLLAL
jgi:hypothetical protein